jgi:hypothetical protein
LPPGVPAQRDEVGNLARLDPVALAHLGRADAGDLGDAFHRLQDGDAIGDELEGVAVGGGDEHRPVPVGRGRCEKVVGFVAGALRDEEAECLDEAGEHIELLEDRRLELATRLVRLERLVPVRRHLERVPGDQHGVGPLGVPQSREEVAEADQRVDRPAADPPDRLRHAVVGAVRERIAVDRQQQAAHSVPSSS